MLPESAVSAAHTAAIRSPAQPRSPPLKRSKPKIFPLGRKNSDGVLNRERANGSSAGR